jgi:membrane AbrB-like protein
VNEPPLPAAPEPPPLPPPGLARRPPAVQWLLLLALTAALTALLLVARLPAALLLGPLFAGIALGAQGVALRIHPRAYAGAQALIGGMIAATITPAIWQTFASHWPWFLAGVFSTLLASSGLGILLSGLRALPGTTAIWGTTPGAATAMVLMAESWGADARLVAFMQYVRVIMVALAAAALAHFWLHLNSAARPLPNWLAPVDWLALAQTLAALAAAALLGARLRIHAGALLLPALAASALHLGGWLRIELPPWLLAATYAVIGWSIGLRFTRQALGHALRALGPVLASVALLIAACGALSWLLARAAGVDPLTAYLAMSPGGMDTVAIIAASSPVDVPFVMTLQAVRLIVVIALGPRLARFVAGRTAAGR